MDCQFQNNHPGVHFGEKFYPRDAHSSHSFYLNMKHFQSTPFIMDTLLRRTISSAGNKHY